MSTAAPLSTHHHRGWSPASRLGRWAVGLAGAALTGTVALAVAFSTGLEPAQSFSDNWVLTSVGMGVLALAVAALVTGVVALTARHDRSWGVVVSAVAAGAVTVLLVQQLLEGLGWLSA